MYKKNEFVFWVQIESGILLQNVNTNEFLELDVVQEKVWEYLDGTHSHNSIIETILQKFKELSKEDVIRKVEDTLAILSQYNLINND